MDMKHRSKVTAISSDAFVTLADEYGFQAQLDDIGVYIEAPGLRIYIGIGDLIAHN